MEGLGVHRFIKGPDGDRVIVARIINKDDKTLTFGNNGSVVAAPPPLVHSYTHVLALESTASSFRQHCRTTYSLYSQSQVTRETWRLHYHQPSPASTAATLSHGQSNGSRSRPAAFCKLDLAVSFTFLFSFYFFPLEFFSSSYFFLLKLWRPLELIHRLCCATRPTACQNVTMSAVL